MAPPCAESCSSSASCPAYSGSRSTTVTSRPDASTLWGAFGYSLSKYLGGLAFVVAIQGAISAVGLFLLGVPYALVLGAFVSVTAVIPYLGAWLSAIPAVIVALTVSPTTALLTALLFWLYSSSRATS